MSACKITHTDLRSAPIHAPSFKLGRSAPPNRNGSHTHMPLVCQFSLLPHHHASLPQPSAMAVGVHGPAASRQRAAEYSRAPGGSGNNQIPEIQRLKPLRAEERRWPVAWVRLWRRDMRDTAGIISDRTKLVSSRRPTSFGAPKTFDERRQERKIRCAVVLRTLERSGHARLSAHLHILLASYILIIMIRLTYLSRAFCSRTITPHLK